MASTGRARARAPRATATEEGKTMSQARHAVAVSPATEKAVAAFKRVRAAEQELDDARNELSATTAAMSDDDGAHYYRLTEEYADHRLTEGRPAPTHAARGETAQ